MLASYDLDAEELRDDAKQEFVRRSDAFRDWMREERPVQFQQELKRVAQRFQEKWQHAGVEDLAAAWNWRYKRSAWQRELRRFPFRSAVARWLSLHTRYSGMRLEKPDQRHDRFGNNYDDMHYAFLAFYTRHLWSKDTELRNTVARLSHGGTRAYDLLEQVPAGSDPTVG